MFAKGAPLIEAKLRKSWQQSVDVAAAAQVLAAQCTLLNPEMAMLAGLVHDIGTLAILRLAESHQAVLDDPQELDNVLDVLSPRIGCMVLQAWHFSPGLIRSEEHTSEIQSLMRISYAVFCLKKKKKLYNHNTHKIVSQL